MRGNLPEDEAGREKGASGLSLRRRARRRSSSSSKQQANPEPIMESAKYSPAFMTDGHHGQSQVEETSLGPIEARVSQHVRRGLARSRRVTRGNRTRTHTHAGVHSDCARVGRGENKRKQTRYFNAFPVDFDRQHFGGTVYCHGYFTNKNGFLPLLLRSLIILLG